MFDPSEGKWDDVIERHFEYIKFYPKNATAFYNLGFNFAQKGQVKNSEIAFLKALELKPDMAEALVNLGGMAFGQRDWDKSIEYNEKAIKIQPALVNAKHNIAYAYFMKSEYERAVALFEELVKADSANGGALYGLANVHYELDNLELSRKYLDRAIELGVEPDPLFLKKFEDD